MEFPDELWFIIKRYTNKRPVHPIHQMLTLAYTNSYSARNDILGLNIDVSICNLQYGHCMLIRCVWCKSPRLWYSKSLSKITLIKCDTSKCCN